MILKPIVDDFKVIGYYMGKLIIGLGIVMAIPFLLALVYSEWQPAMDFLFGMSVALLVGFFFTIICHTKRDLGTFHAMTVASISWLVAMLISAIPLYLSGHYMSFLDAAFESMSGLATTGLTLVNNLDHMARAYNFWRHEMMFIGGQGIVVVALTFLFRGTPGALKMYVGEARDEKILPNVIETARFIWLVSLTYLAIGTFALTIAAISGGLEPHQAVFDSVCIFMAAWDTGGFTPHSQNILFFHNVSLEIITVILMLLGAMNFVLHYAVWSGNRREIYRNIEVKTFFISVTITLSIVLVGLLKQNAYGDFTSFFRKGFYQLISAHTGTGYTTLYPRQFVNEWGPLGMLGASIAMAIGGSVCSTTGAIKLLRVGIIYKALKQDIKKLILTESAVLVQSFHHIRDLILEDKHVRMASLVLLSYVGLYLFGTIAGMLYGYSLSEAAFESISAGANVGLSCGITNPSMPTPLKIIYIAQMWAGRLEFISIFVFAGVILSAIKHRK